jgi:hypothetical protein
MKKFFMMTLTILLVVSLYITNVFAADLDKLVAKETGLLETIQSIIVKLADIKNHWAKDTVEQLISLEAISGYKDGTFRPDNTITRAEFTKIFISSLGFKPLAKTNVKHWAEPYIDEAVKRGYILNGEFDDVDQNITRGEIARMVIRSLDESCPDNMDKYTTQITDYSDIPSQYRDFILKAYVKGIVTGYPDGSFGANQTATRAEASTMIVRTLDESKRIVPELQKDIDDIPFPEIDEKAVIERLKNMKPDNDRWATMEEAHADFLKRYGNSLDKVYDMAVTYENTDNNFDYRTIDNYKDQYKAALAKCLTAKKYKSKLTGEPLTLEQHLDSLIQYRKDHTVIEKARFISDKSLAYLGGKDEAVRVRGYIQFYYAKPTDSSYLNTCKVGQWYEADIEIQFGKFNWSNTLAVGEEIIIGEIREIEGE